MRRPNLPRRVLGGAVVVTAAVATAVTVLAVVGPGGSAGTAAMQPLPGLSRSTAITNASNVLATSIEATQAQLRDEPGNWLAWATLGAAYVQQGRATADPTYYPKAQQALQRSLALNHKD